MGQIVWQRPDGGVSITHTIHPDTEREAASLVERGIIPDDWIIVCHNPDDMPDGRLFRDAWRIKDGKVVIDLQAAISVAKERIRVERVDALAKLDIEYIRAVEDGESTADIVKEKKRLRDLPETIDACTSLEELMSVSV